MSQESLEGLLDQAAGTADPGHRPPSPGLIEEIRHHPDLAAATGPAALRAAEVLDRWGDYGDLTTIAELAARAFEAGLVPAGALLAGATDKLALLSGRPQTYGTVTVEYQGDIVQPPVDPRTTDEERHRLGLPSAAELRRHTAERSRQLARDRAATPGVLPPGQPFCRVWTDPAPDELRARMAVEGARAWADGDVLTFVADSAVPVAVTPVFAVPSWDAGDGLQVLQVRVAGLDEAVITYTFTPLDGSASLDLRRGSHDGRFRGPAAPAELPSNDPVTGTLTDHEVDSAALGGTRRVSVYLPPGRQRADDLPVVYATDGNMFAPYARRLDAAIEAGACPPVLVVAAHAAPADMVRGNQRALEYLAGFDDRRFDAHQRFFVDELATWAEAELGATGHRERRAVFGCSDGGGHALSTGRLHHARFGHIIAYSTGTPPDPALGWDAERHPAVHLCAGTLEPPFHQATAAWAGYLHRYRAPYHFTERVAGHDLIQWCEELPATLARIWG